MSSALVAAWFAPLLADAIWLELTFAAIAGLLWLLNQIFGAANKAGQPGPQRPGAPPVPQRPQQQPQPGLEDVQEFLRRASEQRQRESQRQQQPAKAKQQRSQQQRPQQKKPPQPSQQQQRKPKTIARPLTAEVAQDPMREPSVGAHVQKHLSEKPFQDRSTHLSQVAEAPSQIDSHLHQVFDHQVGRLTTGTESDDDPASEGPRAAVTPAVAIGYMLGNPDSARQAFILGEILRRPDDRW